MAARYRGGGWYIVGCGVVLWGGFLWHVLDERRVTSGLWPPLLAVLLGTALAAGLVYAGRRIAASDRVDRSEVGDILGWGAGGLLLWVAFHGLTVVVWRAQGQAVGDATLPVLTSAGGGLLGGVLLGYLRVGARRDAERARDAREAVEFLNRTLRHEVLNGLNVVQATAGHAEESCDCGGTADPLDTIQSRSDDLAEFVLNIRAFARTFVGEAEIDPVDVGDLLRERAELVRERYPDAVVAVDVPEESPVRANEALGYVFGNLLENAIEHNDRDDPHVLVAADVTADTVVVRVADDGPGIPEEREGSVFEPDLDRDHRIGLYLAQRLVTHYDGEIWLADSGSCGTVVTVELPQAG